MSVKTYDYARIYKNWNLTIFAGKPKTKNPSVKWSDDDNAVKDIDDAVQRAIDGEVNLFAKLGGHLVVLDFDGENWQEGAKDFDERFAEVLLNKAIPVRTGSGKAHLYLFVKALPPNLHKVIKAGNNWQVELRADKHLITLPPSTHPSGGRYEFALPHDQLWKLESKPDEIYLTPYEFSLILEYFDALKTRIITDTPNPDKDFLKLQQDDIRTYALENGKIIENTLNKALTTLRRGNRNDTMFNLAIQFRDWRLSKEETENILSAFISKHPEIFEPDYTIRELRKSIESAYSKPPRPLKYIPLALAKEKAFDDFNNEAEEYGVRSATINLVVKFLRKEWRIDADTDKIYKRAPEGYFEETLDKYALLRAVNRLATQLLKYTPHEAHKTLEKIKNAGINSTYFTEIKAGITQEETLSDNYIYVKNGKIDLKTGELSPYDIEDFVYNVSAIEYDPNAPEPTFFIDMITKMFNSTGIAMKELQKLLGYFITPSINERKFYVFTGKGRNGKTILFETIGEAIGDGFYEVLPSGLIKDNRQDEEHIYAKLKGKRLVVFEEFKEDLVNSTFLKMAVGNDILSGRHRYGRTYTKFKNTAKIVFLTNALPYLDFDSAIKDRIFIIDIRHQFDGSLKKEEVKKKLRGELPGILKYLIQGAVNYYRDREIKLSDKALKEAEERTKELDTLGLFIDEECEIGEGYKVEVSTFVKAFNEWYKRENGDDRRSISSKWITRRMTEKGFDIKRMRFMGDRERYYIGIKLRREW